MLKFGVIWFLLLGLHPVHVSISSLEFDENENMCRLFVKVYTDDLENDCRLMTGNHELQLNHEGLGPDTITIRNYINEKIIVAIDKKVLVGEISVIEYGPEEVRITATYGYKGKVRSLKIVNKVMTELFSDQANLFIVRIGDWEEGIKFTPDYREVIINR